MGGKREEVMIGIWRRCCKFHKVGAIFLRCWHGIVRLMMGDGSTVPRYWKKIDTQSLCIRRRSEYRI